MDHRAAELVVCDAARGEDLARVGAGVPSTRAAREGGRGDDAVAAGETLEGGAVREARPPHAHILDESEIAHLADAGQASGSRQAWRGRRMRARRCSSAPLASATRQAQWASLGSVGRLVRDPLGNKLARRLVVVWLDAADVVRLARRDGVDERRHLRLELRTGRRRPRALGTSRTRHRHAMEEPAG